LRSGISLIGGVRSQELYTHARQLLAGIGRVVIAISEDVAKREGGVVRTLGQELLPEDLLELPEVCCLQLARRWCDALASS
jgi:hypothetical protein